MKVLIYIILLCGFLFQGLSAQNNFPQQEDSLKRILRRIPVPENDFERLAANFEFKQYFEEVLSSKESFAYPFDSLFTVSRLRDPLGNFRIISWYVPLKDGKFEYFGFFQSYDARKGDYQLYPLTDRAGDASEVQFETLDHNNWYGAYYLELIHEKHRRNDYYVLLGWRADNPLTRKRVIEPLKIMGQGRPSFGSPVFRYDNNRHRRILFEYSARVSMTMRYEPHAVEQGRRSQHVIVFDRMTPTQSFLEGHYQFYVPETNIFDGFLFEEGKWIFIPEIDARNPNRRPPPRPVPQD